MFWVAPGQKLLCSPIRINLPQLIKKLVNHTIPLVLSWFNFLQHL